MAASSPYLVVLPQDRHLGVGAWPAYADASGAVRLIGKVGCKVQPRDGRARLRHAVGPEQPAVREQAAAL
eukprot:7517114-Pyramimonas_sp.AAC.1